MKREYALQGLDCANCAAKIETAVKALPGVKSAGCDALRALLVLELDADSAYSESFTAQIEKIVHTYEPDVVVAQRRETAQTGDERSSVWQLIRIAAGAVLFAAALIISADVKPYIFLLSFAILGWDVVYGALRTLLRGRVFDENFLMSLAGVGAIVIGEYPEAAAVMLFYQIGEFFQELAVHRSRRSIAGLMDIRPDFANKLTGGELMRVSPEDIMPGDTIVVRPGEKIPLDGVVTDGFSSLDTRALTGESVPRDAGPGDAVLSGCVNQSGVLTIEVTKPFGESTAARILELVENASSKKAPTENFITTFSRYYTPVVTGLAAALAVLPPLLFGGEWAAWLHRALVFLVISCPCALVISVPLGFFGGIGRASRSGVLVKGSNFLEALGKLEIVVFDKTGTLTKGVFNVTHVCPAAGFTESRLLEYAALAESYSNHPAAKAILSAYGVPPRREGLTDYAEHPGRGTEVTADGIRIIAGNAAMLTDYTDFAENDEPGTKVYVGVDGRFAGCIVISDELKPDSAEALDGLKALGVRKTVMLTGDNHKAAEAAASQLPIDEFYAELMPAQKVEIVESLNSKKESLLAFVGDGVNDAPVLAIADVGVAMGGLGSDAAIEAADVVLMTDEPSKLAEAVKIARKTKRIVWQNIVLALGIKAVFLLLGAAGVSGMWEAVFADVGVSLLAILNSLRLLK